MGGVASRRWSPRARDRATRSAGTTARVHNRRPRPTGVVKIHERPSLIRGKSRGETRRTLFQRSKVPRRPSSTRGGCWRNVHCPRNLSSANAVGKECPPCFIRGTAATRFATDARLTADRAVDNAISPADSASRDSFFFFLFISFLSTIRPSLSLCLSSLAVCLLFLFLSLFLFVALYRQQAIASMTKGNRDVEKINQMK